MKPTIWMALLSAATLNPLLLHTLEASARPQSGSPSSGSVQPARSLSFSYQVKSASVDILLTGLPANVRLFTTRTTNGYQVLAEGPDIGSVNESSIPSDLRIDDPAIRSVRLDVAGNQARLLFDTPSPQAPLIRSTGSQLIFSFPKSRTAQSQTFQQRLAVDSPALRPYAPPFTRAVAPPVGQIVSGILAIPNPSMIKLSGPPITLNARGLSAQSALDYIARRGGYDIVFVKSDPTFQGSQSSQSPTLPVTPLSSSTDAPGAFVPQSTPPNSPQAAASSGNSQSGSGSQSTLDNPRLISLSLRSKPYSQAFNSVLTASGLQATYRDGIIYVGPDIIQKAVGERISKTYRLNQVSAQSAAQFLGNLGASMTYTNTVTTAVSTGVPTQNAVSSASTATTTQSSTSAQVLTYGSNVGPLLGLSGTTDDRLSQVTIVGESQLVNLAGEYLRRIDLRTRQVALTIRIYDVDLSNNIELSNQLSYSDGKVILTSDPENGNVGAVFNPSSPAGGSRGFPPTNPFTTTQAAPIIGSDGTTVTAPSGLYVQGQDRIVYDTFRALTTSQASKLLASPTVILMEDNSQVASSSSASQSAPNQASLFVGENVITGLEPVENTNACKQSFSQVGLDLKTILTKIDDNGFVTFRIEPTLTAPDKNVPVPGCGNQTIVTTAERTLKSGSSRVRDGQTLILTGVLSDKESTLTRKVPLLGDLPLFGSLFRSSGTDRRKRELVITVTPRILKDDNQDSYGYYSPSTSEVRGYLGR